MVSSRVRSVQSTPIKSDEKVERVNVRTAFPNVTVEGRPYPSVILGEDSFTGWFKKNHYQSDVGYTQSYQKTLDVSYRLGVRG